MMRAILGAALLAARGVARAQFTLQDPSVLERYDRFQGYTMRWGPEDKFLEVNNAPVFVDLDEIWEEFAVDAEAQGDDCTVLLSEGPLDFNDCQRNCSGNPYGRWPAASLCNAINYNYLPIDPDAPLPDDARCQYLQCNDNPPGTDPAPGWMLWTYNRGTSVIYDTGSSTWKGVEIDSTAACVGTGVSVPLVPRDNAYSVGIVNNRGVAGGDRIIVIGGDSVEDNVYYSDDSGATFQCYDGPQIWSARGYSVIIHPTGIFPGDPVFMMGGEVDEDTPSIGMFVNVGDGTAGWARPTCTPGDCGVDECFDAPGTYCLPTAPVFPGQVVTDWTTMWLFDDISPGQPIYYLNATNYGQGWLALPDASGAATAGQRRVYIKGQAPGSGCFFATDFTASHLWLPGADATASSAFATSRTVDGPWVLGTAPWAERGSAVVTTSEDQTIAWVGGGFSFYAGTVEKPTQGDLWEVDASVCLLGPNGEQCSGNAVDIDPVNLVCNCLPNWAGDDRCSTCTLGQAYNPSAGCLECPVAFGGGPCNDENGWGVCDPVRGCVCTFNHRGANCGQCAIGHYGTVCAACDACDPVGGVCDGSGTSIGSGACMCNDGYMGDDCSQLIPPPKAAAAGLSPGAAAAVSLLVIGLSAGAGLFVWVKVFGGGPALAAVAAKARALVPSVAAVSGNERAGLLTSVKQGAMSPLAAQARFSAPAGRAVDDPA